MLTLRRLVLSTVFVFVFPVGAFAQSLESQFETFLSWWPGDYDNAHQADPSASGSPMATRLFIRAIDLPAFGDHVVYAEWQALDDPDRIVRQRFYGFEIDEERSALRLNLHIFPPTPEFIARTRGAHEDPSRVADVTRADMVPLPGCDVYFTWNGTHFEGAMIKGECAFPAPGTETPIYSWSQMRLTEDSFEYLDGWFNLDGSVYQQMSNAWYEFKRQ